MAASVRLREPPRARSSLLVALAAISFGGFYTPGMALVSDRAEAVGLAQGLGFGIMNTAWALGNMTGPVAGGALAEAAGDAVPYLLAARPLPADARRRRFRRWPESARAPSRVQRTLRGRAPR